MALPTLYRYTSDPQDIPRACDPRWAFLKNASYPGGRSACNGGFESMCDVLSEGVVDHRSAFLQREVGSKLTDTLLLYQTAT